jgi:hypothetical protein
MLAATDVRVRAPANTAEKRQDRIRVHVKRILSQLVPK